jgi:PAS domain-containing protein
MNVAVHMPPAENISPAMNIAQDLLAQALNESREGIIIDARQLDFPLIYVNEGFEKLTGYTSGEVIGKNYHVLYGDDTEHRRRPSSAGSRYHERTAPRAGQPGIAFRQVRRTRPHARHRRAGRLWCP